MVLVIFVQACLNRDKIPRCTLRLSAELNSIGEILGCLHQYGKFELFPLFCIVSSQSNRWMFSSSTSLKVSSRGLVAFLITREIPIFRRYG